MIFKSQTDKGMVRTVNEDFLGILKGINVFVVADGVGGNAGGNVASKLAVDEILSYISANYKDCQTSSPEDILRKAANKANTSIYKKAQENKELSGMGSTIVICWFIDDILYIAHAGDSRAYLFRNRKIFQLTRDHSFVEEQLEQNIITKKQAENSQYKNFITRAIGSEENVVVDISQQLINKGDYVLLCTDGLTSLLNDEEIMNIILNSEENMEVACHNLIVLPNSRGGNDNITVILAKVVE
jgi:protein phosphatase